MFGDLCVTSDKEYINFIPGTSTPETRINRSNDHFLQGKEYLTEMVIASTCNSFVTARCSGSASVMMLTENFENVYAFNLGRDGLITLG